MAIENLTEGELNTYDIFRLRDMARKVGIKNASTRSKGELVFAISQLNGRGIKFEHIEVSNTAMVDTATEIVPVKRGRGRPPKNTPYHVETVKTNEISNSKPEVKENINSTNCCENEGNAPRVQATNDEKSGKTYGNYASQTRNDKEYPAFDNKKNNYCNNKRKYNEVKDSGDFVRSNYLSSTINQDNQDNKTPTSEELLASGEYEQSYGLLDIHSDGYGFLRANNCEYGLGDVYVTNKMIKTFGLRCGDMVNAIVSKKRIDNKPPAVIAIESVNGRSIDGLKKRPNFDELVPIYPDERLRLEVSGARSDFAIRCIDLIAPIGKGQRAMIVSPPKAGKTTLLKKIASSIAINHPEVELFVLLVDERPEEVTDMKRSIKGTVIYSTFDETPEHHCKSAELLIERAKRNVELGKDVVIIMDSLTRLARAYNLVIPPTGRSLSGGMDPGALHNPKRFFGSARNIENGGSLTIIATALVDTGSRMDDVIYEEFKGTGNMEIHLDRKLSERRIFPAIDLNRSSTRREDLLLNQKELEGVWAMRKMLSGGENLDMTEQLLNMLVKTKNNAEFLENICLQMKAIEKEGYSFRK